MSKCENCEQENSGEYGSGRFCSSKCARGFSTKKKRLEINKKVSKALTKGKVIKGKRVKKLKDIKYKECQECSILFNYTKDTNIFCSNKCCRSNQNKIGDIALKISIKAKERVKNGTHIGWQSRKVRSYAELFFENVLINNNINFDSEHVVSKTSLGLNDSSNYFLDFYLTDYNIDLEIDGKQHEYEERKIKDKERDNLLTINGYNVYRIKWKNPNTDANKLYIKEEIDKLLEYLKNVAID